MAANLPRLIDATDKVEVQNTVFTTDVLGRFICNSWDEATQNGGVGFDAVVIGAGMFGAYCAEKIYVARHHSRVWPIASVDARSIGADGRRA